MLFQQVREGIQYVTVKLTDVQFAGRLVIRQPVISFPVVSASAVGILPTEPLIHIIGREGCRRPVMAIRAGLGIHKKSVKQTEALRQRMMIGSHRLLRARRPSRGVAVPENDRAAVLPTLSVFFLLGRKLCVRWIRREPAVADPHGGWFESRAFPISDEEFAVCHGNCGGILTRRNKPEDL